MMLIKTGPLHIHWKVCSVIYRMSHSLPSGTPYSIHTKLSPPIIRGLMARLCIAVQDRVITLPYNYQGPRPVSLFNVCSVIYRVSHSLPNPALKILQRNLNRSTFVVWEMKRNVYVVHLIVVTRSSGPPASGKIIKEMLGSVASGTPYSIRTKLSPPIITGILWWQGCVLRYRRG